MNSLKHNKALRILAKPYIEWKQRRIHRSYLCSPDHFYLQTLQGIHEGKRCFIIGNDPSLRAEDLDMLKGEYTFAANRVFKIFNRTDWRPMYYLSVDDRVLKETQCELMNYDFGHMFLRYGKTRIAGSTNKITKIFIEPLNTSAVVALESSAREKCEDIHGHCSYLCIVAD